MYVCSFSVVMYFLVHACFKVIITLVIMPMFRVLSSCHSYCESSPGLFDKCSTENDDLNDSVYVMSVNVVVGILGCC